jgi:hypothetical protein
MPSIINSDNGSVSGSAGLKITSGDDGILKIQSSGTDVVNIAADGVISARDLNPVANNTHDLGTAALRWRNIYTNDLNLKNDLGDWTIVEGEDDLFLYNNKRNKVYKFALIEIDAKDAAPKASDSAR